MHDFPHHYDVDAAAAAAGGEVALSSPGLDEMWSASPAEFDGPGDLWSPETLLVGAIADCFVLTFRAVARASRLPWTAVSCRVTGTLDRIDRVTQFTAFTLHVRLDVPADTNVDLARRALEKAERTCLISNSLKAPMRLEAEVVQGSASVQGSADRDQGSVVQEQGVLVD